MSHELYLPILMLLPTVGALLVGFAPGGGKTPRQIGLFVSLLTFGLAVALLLGFQGASAAQEFVFRRPWFELSGIPLHFAFGVDGLSILLVALTALLMPLVFLAMPGFIHEREKEFVIWALLMEMGMVGVFAAQDLVLFYVFWELTLVPLYFIIGIWGGTRKLYATIKFFLYTLAGSLLMLVGVILLLRQTGTADLGTLANAAIPPSLQWTCFLLFTAAFAVKVPLVPFHTWLPDAHVEAPTGGSVILAGVLLKMGTYGLLRFCLPMFPDAAREAGPWMMGLGAFGVVYGALLAWAQTDLKKMVAYSSVSHMGLIVLGIFAFHTTALQGALIQMINHGLSTGALFLLVGALYERRHTRDLSEFGGLAKVMPVFALVLGIVSFSSIGLPGLNGFVGEFLVLLGSFQAAPWIASFAALGVVLGAVYMLSGMRRILFGEITRRENRALQDLSRREIFAFLPLLALIVWIGIAPGFFLQKSEASAKAVSARVLREVGK